MKKLTQKSTDLIKKVIETCNLCGIDSVSIENGIARGQNMDNNKGNFFLTNIETDNLEFDELGLGRLKTLLTRLKLLNDLGGDDYEIFYNIKERDNHDQYVTKLVLKNKKTKIEYKCTDSRMIKAPKKFKGNVLYSFELSEDTIKIMAKAISALETNLISFSSDDDGSVRFKSTDTEGDTFDHIIADTYEKHNDAELDNFFFAYDIKNLLGLFKARCNEKGNVYIQIMDRGVMKIDVNGFDIYILRES